MAPNKVSMKTKTSAKSSSSKSKGKAPVSKLASLKGALKDVMPKALFNATKGAKGAKAAPAKAAPAKGAPAKAAKSAPAAKAAPAPKAAAPAKGKAAAASAKTAAAPAPAPALTKPLTKAPKKATGLAKSPRAPRLSPEDMCREVACESLCTSGGYCRLHYIKNWKKIKRKELILKEGKLNQYIEELVAKYPDKYIEAIRQDLNDDKAFAQVIHDLDLDESVDDFEVDGENLESMVDNIKGRDFDDDGDAF